MVFRKQEQGKSAGLCPIVRTANLMGDSFIIVIIRDLFFGPKRFSDFVESLTGVSTRTVSNKLKFLEKEGIIERKVISKQPPHVTYSLTKAGKGLQPIVRAMLAYGEKYLS